MNQHNSLRILRLIVVMMIHGYLKCCNDSLLIYKRFFATVLICCRFEYFLSHQTLINVPSPIYLETKPNDPKKLSFC